MRHCSLAPGGGVQPQAAQQPTGVAGTEVPYKDNGDGLSLWNIKDRLFCEQREVEKIHWKKLQHIQKGPLSPQSTKYIGAINLSSGQIIPLAQFFQISIVRLSNRQGRFWSREFVAHELSLYPFPPKTKALLRTAALLTWPLTTKPASSLAFTTDKLCNLGKGTYPFGASISMSV